jgi:glycosyltransferase involved in cell wall biosynthesis
LKEYDASIVIPARNEDANIATTLKLLEELQNIVVEILIVVDSKSDTTLNSFNELSRKPSSAKVLVQNDGPGPANAIRYGIANASSECVVVLMADGSDDIRSIPDLVALVKRGVVIACASRYMPGGQQIGGPRIKRFLSRYASKALYHLAGVGTRDSTNSFKAYSKKFIEDVGIESLSGFEMGIEMVAKARGLRLPVAEVPTIWLDRTLGSSNFQLTKWLPKYLKWFLICFRNSSMKPKADMRENRT